MLDVTTPPYRHPSLKRRGIDDKTNSDNVGKPLLCNSKNIVLIFDFNFKIYLQLEIPIRSENAFMQHR